MRYPWGRRRQNGSPGTEMGWRGPRCKLGVYINSAEYLVHCNTRNCNRSPSQVRMTFIVGSPWSDAANREVP
jgi:hypothetical protein